MVGKGEARLRELHMKANDTRNRRPNRDVMNTFRKLNKWSHSPQTMSAFHMDIVQNETPKVPSLMQEPLTSHNVMNAAKVEMATTRLFLGHGRYPTLVVLLSQDKMGIRSSMTAAVGDLAGPLYFLSCNPATELNKLNSKLRAQLQDLEEYRNNMVVLCVLPRKDDKVAARAYRNLMHELDITYGLPSAALVFDARKKSSVGVDPNLGKRVKAAYRKLDSKTYNVLSNHNRVNGSINVGPADSHNTVLVGVHVAQIDTGADSTAQSPYLMTVTAKLVSASTPYKHRSLVVKLSTVDQGMRWQFCGGEQPEGQAEVSSVGHIIESLLSEADLSSKNIVVYRSGLIPSMKKKRQDASLPVEPVCLANERQDFDDLAERHNAKVSFMTVAKRSKIILAEHRPLSEEEVDLKKLEISKNPSKSIADRPQTTENEMKEVVNESVTVPLHTSKTGCLEMALQKVRFIDGKTMPLTLTLHGAVDSDEMMNQQDLQRHLRAAFEASWDYVPGTFNPTQLAPTYFASKASKRDLCHLQDCKDAHGKIGKYRLRDVHEALSGTLYYL